MRLGRSETKFVPSKYEVANRSKASVEVESDPILVNWLKLPGGMLESSISPVSHVLHPLKKLAQLGFFSIKSVQGKA